MKLPKYIYSILMCIATCLSVNAQVQPPCPDDLILTEIMQDQDGITLGQNAVVVTKPDKNDTEKKGNKERLISWVHGLGGNTESWIFASGDIQSRYRTRPTRPTYSQQSLVSGGQSLYSHMQTVGYPVIQQANLDIEDSFVIAHSHGGLTSRSAFRLQSELETPETEQLINGLVTFGTGHGGAEIAGNSDEIIDWVTDGVARLVETYTDLAISSSQYSFLINTVIEGVIGESVADIIANGSMEVADFLGEFLIPIALSPFDQPVTEDIVPGAPALVDLNNWSPSDEDNIPTVAFYGVEEDPVLWRYVSSVQFDKTNAFYGDDYDETVPNAIDDLIIEHEALSELFYATWELETADDCDPWDIDFLSPWCAADYTVDNIIGHDIFDDEGELIGNFIVTDMYDNYLNFNWTADWFANANDVWKLITGAAEAEVIASCKCDVYVNGSFNYSLTVNPGSLTCYEFAQDNSNGVYLYNCYDNGWSDIVEFESDGVTTVSSQIAFPNVGFTKQMDNTNHQQMRNCTETKKRLNDLMGGEFGEYFITEERQ